MTTKQMRITLLIVDNGDEIEVTNDLHAGYRYEPDDQWSKANAIARAEAFAQSIASSLSGHKIAAEIDKSGVMP